MSIGARWSRRRLLSTLGAGAGYALSRLMHAGASAPEHATQTSLQTGLDLSWINQREGPRPQFAWENWEDLIYDSLQLPDSQAQLAPEFCALMQSVWVFNRAMQWYDENLDGCIICYSAAGDLPLTGENQISSWHSDPENAIIQRGEFTHFEKKSTRRRRDCAVLPCLEFHLGQHPILEVRVPQASDEWQFCVSIKGRSGPPLASSGWCQGPGEWSCDLSSELSRRGYRINFPELHFIMGVWCKDARAQSALDFQAMLKARPAVVACLPVIRAALEGKADVPLAAVALDSQGQRLGSDCIKLFAQIEGKKHALEERRGFWKGCLRDLPVGDYEVNFSAQGRELAGTSTPVRVTDGQYFSIDKSSRFAVQEGQVIGPLSGSSIHTCFFRGVGQSTECMVNGQQAWDRWKEKETTGDRLHYWEALTEKELDERFAYLARCGFDLVYLLTHWGEWERLDAGGRIAPHAVEQVALYIRAAWRHKLATVQALTHYPYVDSAEKSGDSTIPYSQYLEAGFKTKDWAEVGTNPRFEEMFHEYMREFLAIFKEETGLFALHASGEGDWKNGLARSDDIFRFVRSVDSRHVFLAEPIWRMEKLPQEYIQGWDQDLLGARTYFVGDEILPEFDLGVEFKFYQLGGLYKAEGEWATSNLCLRAHERTIKGNHPSPQSWVGTQRYRTRLRDALYLSLVHRLPLVMQWDEEIAEDEHIIFKQLRDQIDWSQKFMEPAVAVRVDDSNVMGKGRANLAAYEKAFARLPLAYQLILPDKSAPKNVAVVIDAREAFRDPRFKSAGGLLPESLGRSMPLHISGNYCCNYAWSEDRRILLAYIYNVTQHIEKEQYIGGRFQRIPRATMLRLDMLNLPGDELTFRLYDLDSKELSRQGKVHKQSEADLGLTDHDYFLMLSPS